MRITKIMMLEHQHTTLPARSLRLRLGVFLLLYLLGAVTYAQSIEETLPSGIITTANFRSAVTTRPAVLLVHGFLQTPNYQTAISLADAVTDANYTLLAPTLSLGINKRRKSLPCEALHLHTMQQDVAEIAFWVDWLAAKGYNNIIIVGHSYGSLEAIVYAAGTPNAIVKKIIATSLVDPGHTVGEEYLLAQAARARAAIQKGVTEPLEFPLSYCKKYVALASAFLSYAEWSKARILKALTTTKISLNIVLGSDDNRTDKRWPDLLRANHAHVSIINGANHFFDAEYEFDLIDRVLALINEN